jgi:prepilin-type N-terminal cleavage/methylation domain-containing protein
LLRKRLKNEAGYSLVEVMVSIIILAIAIIPLVAMFDMGLNSATAASNYDKARALANLKMEEAKSLSYAAVEGNFPEAGNTTPYTTVNPINGPAGFTGFQYEVEKDYMTQPPKGSDDDPVDPTETFIEPDPPDTATGLIRVTVIVYWDCDDPADSDTCNTYTTYGLVSQ